MATAISQSGGDYAPATLAALGGNATRYGPANAPLVMFHGADDGVIGVGQTAPLARAYGAIYKDQRGRDYVGMRDYYELLKNLRRTLAESGAELTPDTLTFALMRNFGGRRDVAAPPAACRSAFESASACAAASFALGASAAFSAAAAA